MTEETGLLCKKITINILEDFICINDWFLNFLNLVQPNDPSHGIELDIKGKLNGLNTIFILRNVTNLGHQTILEDMAFEITKDTRNKGLSIYYRAVYICEAWQLQFERWKETK